MSVTLRAAVVAVGAALQRRVCRIVSRKACITCEALAARSKLCGVRAKEFCSGLQLNAVDCGRV